MPILSLGVDGVDPYLSIYFSQNYFNKKLASNLTISSLKSSSSITLNMHTKQGLFRKVDAKKQKR
ncbi:MAG: hypothetical protein ACI85U_004135 [Candidatus Promineifilaceae bacterium]|jgi:hypothetical protein